MEHSTIAAIATAPGAGGIAVVRLSGPESYAVAAKVFCPANPAKRVEDAKGYTALFGHFMEGEEAFDEGVALFFREPHSYTGEDSAEFHCHGSPVVLHTLLSALFAAGARQAQAGEFTKRAFLNGKMDLTEAEAVIEAMGYDPERDVENTADSVFCSHGAGVVIPWREVAQHAQVDSGWRPQGTESEPKEAPPQRRPVSTYAGTAAQDKELQAIFERTYGATGNRRFYWQNSVTSAGNLLSGILRAFGERQPQTLFGNRFSQFVKEVSEVKFYHRIGRRNNWLATRLLVGAGYAYGNSEVMPYSEQFYIGGANSIRAFTIRSLGPGSYRPPPYQIGRASCRERV